MKNPSCGFSKEGVPFTALCALLTLSLAMLDCATGTAVMFVLTALVAHFFRDPERVVPSDPGVAVSPADGKVCKVGTAVDPISGERRKVVCVFMNVFNVHVNRAPVAGEVRRLKYFPGKYLNASLDKASEDNERLAMSIKDAKGVEWTVVQIAGLIARRIVCWAEEGDELARGVRFGLIKFGSRLDLYIPDAYEIDVHVGEKVLAGQTILAKRNEDEHTSGQ